MAERRPPGFNVDLGFYDSPEVLSIPRKVRAAAIGVWTLAGAYSASKLTDGEVSDEKLKELGCTPVIRAALMSTTPEPLWVESNAHSEAIQFTRWTKWQRTCAEVKAYRDADAERKRLAREAKKKPSNAHPATIQPSSEAHPTLIQAPSNAHPTHNLPSNQAPHDHVDDSITSTNSETSGRTTAGRPKIVRPDSRDPKSESESESKSLSTSLTLVEGGPGGDPNLPVAAKAAPADTRRGHRLPEGWRPSENTIAAMRQQFPHVDLKAIHAEFIDYWQAIPGAKGRKLDWDGTWRNRVREIASRNLPARHNHSPPNGIGKPTQKAMGWEAAAQELLAEMENDR